MPSQARPGHPTKAHYWWLGKLGSDREEGPDKLENGERDDSSPWLNILMREIPVEILSPTRLVALNVMPSGQPRGQFPVANRSSRIKCNTMPFVIRVIIAAIK